MEALKWIGSIAGAIVALSVAIGLALAAGTIVAIVAAFVVLAGIVLLAAGLIKSFWEEVF